MTSESAPPGTRLGDLVRRAARARLVGRDAELAWLERSLLDDETKVVFVHGIGGIGKTSLLDALETRLDARGVRVVRFDGQSLEPTPRGVSSGLGRALGVDASDGISVDDVVARLDESADAPIVLAFDEYDALRLVDAWIRRVLLPALPTHARAVFVGRSRPVASWTTTPGWDALVRVLELGPMNADDARALVVREEVEARRHDRIVAITGGHPLAIKLATAAVRARPDLPLAEVESRHVVGELVRRYLAGLDVPEQRAAVEAASLLRRVNRPLLAAMLGEAEAARAMATLESLPFVEAAADGLVIHPAVRHAVAASFRAVDPERVRALRTLAWQKLSADIDRETAGATRSWHLTADVVYLVDDPTVRDAFFPSDTIRFGIEPALPSDREAVLAIAREHAGEHETKVLAAWWEHLPSACFVVRDEAGSVRGFYVAAFFADVPPALVAADPLLERWIDHARTRFPRNGRPMIASRMTLSAKDGPEPCEERAACFLDVNRSYMANLDLAAIYTAHYHGGEAALCGRMGFDAFPELAIPTGPGGDVTTAMLDFGSGVLPWLHRLLDAQWEGRPLGALPRGTILCRAAKELIVDGERRPLTRLEFGLLDYLDRHAGAVCSRDELLESVWGQAHTGSNVVDAVVRSIRKKLGEHAGIVQTVTGHGYRLKKGEP